MTRKSPLHPQFQAKDPLISNYVKITNSYGHVETHTCVLLINKDLSQGPRPGRGIEGLNDLVNVLFSSYRPLSGIVIVLSDPIVIQNTKTFRKT